MCVRACVCVCVCVTRQVTESRGFVIATVERIQNLRPLKKPYYGNLSYADILPNSNGFLSYSLILRTVNSTSCRTLRKGKGLDKCVCAGGGGGGEKGMR